MVQYTLKYFPARGRAEVARLLFALADQKYEDVRITHEEWAKLKEGTPFGQLPVLEVDGKVLGQSNAIARYLARQFGFAGKSAWEEAQVDAVADQWNDFANEIQPFLRVVMGFVEGDKEKMKKEIFEPALHKHFPFFVKFVKASGSGFLVGSSVTWVDLLISEFTSRDPNSLADYPEMKAHYEKVRSIPEIKKWIETRPETPF